MRIYVFSFTWPLHFTPRARRAILFRKGDLPRRRQRIRQVNQPILPGPHLPFTGEGRLFRALTSGNEDWTKVRPKIGLRKGLPLSDRFIQFTMALAFVRSPLDPFFFTVSARKVLIEELTPTVEAGRTPITESLRLPTAKIRRATAGRFKTSGPVTLAGSMIPNGAATANRCQDREISDEMTARNSFLERLEFKIIPICPGLDWGSRDLIPRVTRGVRTDDHIDLRTKRVVKERSLTDELLGDRELKRSDRIVPEDWPLLAKATERDGKEQIPTERFLFDLLGMKSQESLNRPGLTEERH